MHDAQAGACWTKQISQEGQGVAVSFLPKTSLLIDVVPLFDSEETISYQIDNGFVRQADFAGALGKPLPRMYLNVGDMGKIYGAEEDSCSFTVTSEGGMVGLRFRLKFFDRSASVLADIQQLRHSDGIVTSEEFVPASHTQ